MVLMLIIPNAYEGLSDSCKYFIYGNYSNMKHNFPQYTVLCTDLT